MRIKLFHLHETKHKINYLQKCKLCSFRYQKHHFRNKMALKIMAVTLAEVFASRKKFKNIGVERFI